MPWLETSPVEQRERFIRDHRVGLHTMTELERFDEAGRRGLQDRTGRRTIVPTGSRRRSRP